MDIKPLLEALASLETACIEAIDCLDVLAWRSAGPEFGALRRLQDLLGGDGNGGHRKTIQELNGVVGHCLNLESDMRDYRFGILMDYDVDRDGGVTELDRPLIDGSEPHVVQASNSVDALLKLLEDSQGSLNSAIAKVTGGGLMELFNMKNDGLALVDNAWKRLSNHWQGILEAVDRPSGLDVSGFRAVIREEINAAKNTLTFGSPLSATNGATPRTEHSEQRPKRKGRKRKVDPLEAEILRVHKYGQSHAETAEIANVKTPDGRWDTQKVAKVLKRVKQRKARKRSTK